ncbi:hypothetical protein CR513_36360, partial [Mucuna pruriens]
MKAFPFFLDGATKDWLYLQPVPFRTWGNMKHMFLEKFFPASKTATIQKEICGIRLYAMCLQHQISKQLLIQYFYEGLMMMDQGMIDATSYGALTDKKPAVGRQLMSNMANNIQQFRTKGAGPSRAVNEAGAIDNLRLENQLTELTSLVRQLAVGQHQQNIPGRVCGICTFMEYPTNMCPTLHKTKTKSVKVVRAISGHQYNNQPYPSQPYQSRPHDSQRFGRQPYQLSPSPEQYSAPRFGFEPAMPIPTNSMSQLQSAGFDNLPSQTIPNPRGGNANVMALRSGRELPQQPAPQQMPRPTDAESNPKANSPI